MPFELARIEQADQDGWVWSVLVIKPGMGANRQYFPAQTLQAAVAKFNGARVFCLPDSQHSRTGDKSAKNIVGWIEQAEWRAEQGIVGRLTLMKSADWLRQNLLDSHAKGKPDLYGLSIDAPGKAKIEQIDGARAQVFTEVLEPVTVDVVWNPGTPGGFQRALNAVAGDGATIKEERMKEQLLAILQAKRPDLLKGKDVAALTEEQLTTLLDEAMTPAQQADQGHDKDKKEANAQAQNAGGGLSEDDRATLRQAKVSVWNQQAVEQIQQSKLPEPMQASLRKRFLDEPGNLAHVEQAISDYRGLVDKLSPEGKVAGLGFANDMAVESEPERLQQSMDRLFGLDVKGDAPAFVGLRQAYVRITGDVHVRGLSGHPLAKLQGMTKAFQAMAATQVDSSNYPLPDYVRISQAQLAGAWALILGNSLYRRLRREYLAVDYHESMIISNRRRANDYRALEAMAPHYPPDLPIINSDADYTERPTMGEEAVNYKVTKRGRILTVSREVILNDDLGVVMRDVRTEGRAARRTFARFVWNLLIGNAVFDGDAIATFHATHNNLGSVALTANAAGITALTNRLIALMGQTEPGSGEKLGGAWWGARPILAVHGDLQAIAKQLNQSGGVPGAANEGDNPVKGLFGNADSPERIIVNPLFTDSNDWYLFRQPSDMEMIEVAFLLGQEEPELFLADAPGVGQMFLADKTQFKIRHEYGGEIVDYRGMDKSVVA